MVPSDKPSCESVGSMASNTRSKARQTSVAKKAQARRTSAKSRTDTAVQPGTPDDAMRAVIQEANMRNMRNINERAKADTARRRAGKRTG